MKKAKVQSDSFLGDLANALLLSQPHREPYTPTRQEIKQWDAHSELANLILPVLAETTVNEQFAVYDAGRVATAILKAGYRKK